MEDYNKIIESLNVHFKKANNIRITQPITIENYYDVENTIIRLNNGEIRFGKEKELVKEKASEKLLRQKHELYEKYQDVEALLRSRAGEREAMGGLQWKGNRIQITRA